MTTPTRKELLELIELIEELAAELFVRPHNETFYAYDSTNDRKRWRQGRLAKRVNTVLANPPVIEEKLLGVDIFPNGKTHVDIYEDMLEDIAREIDQRNSQIDKKKSVRGQWCNPSVDKSILEQSS